ncbi:putative SAM-dependent methyltransferase [Betaentomopoxvirus amoorei]|uniref:AMV004 n=1 Tax=Amsacta moorei entomopoxvirus TaxID=28321 RepID=Q9EN42_AMEPV|nr:putative SAM-dependent methyltransferase [Amsacta moorei entomopoxvirus]AAG02710.1 AMV004 [Amsacta moorei entomopoxvirus]
MANPNIIIFSLCIIHTYCWDTNYVNISNFQYDSSISFISKININKNDSIIDIGCGHGKITHYLSNITDNTVLGIDKSYDLINYAKNNYIKNNLKFKTLDITTDNITNIINKKYDIILSFFCIPWIKNKNIVFSNIAKISNHNAHIYIMGALMEKTHVMLINELIKKPYWKQYYINFESPFDYLNDINYEYYANNSGIFTIIKNISNIYYTFNNRKELHDFNLAILPHLKVLNKEDKTKFVDELLDDYFKYIGREEYNIKFNVIKFIGYIP